MDLLSCFYDPKEILGVGDSTKINKRGYKFFFGKCETIYLALKKALKKTRIE